MRIATRESKKEVGSPFKSLLQGFRFAMSDLPIRSTLLLLSLVSLLGLQYSVFMPIFAEDILHKGKIGFGILMSTAGIGAVLGALHFAARTSYKGLARWIAATSTTCAVGLVVFSQSKIFVLSLAVLLIVGFCATVQMAATNTTLQNRVPDHLRGRIMAVYATMFMGVQPIGSLLAGGVAKWIGAPYTLAVFGTLCFLGSLVFIFRVALPAQRRSEASAAA
jgi:MFS family permease